MKVKLGDIKPNPFRYLNKGYPINQAKVERLRASINRTGFWDNIVARVAPNGKGYEIAYGHHRVEALRQDHSPSFEIDLIIREIDDAKMLQIMASENDTIDIMSPAVINETVRAAVKFLEADITALRKNARCQNPAKIIPPTPAMQEAIKAAKKYSQSSVDCLVAQFLDWPLHRCGEAMTALAAIDRGAIGKEEYESFPSQFIAEAFRNQAVAHGLTAPQRKLLLERLSSVEFNGRMMRKLALEIKFPSMKGALSPIVIDDLAHKIIKNLSETSVLLTDSFIENARAISPEVGKLLIASVNGFMARMRKAQRVNSQLGLEESK